MKQDVSLQISHNDATENSLNNIIKKIRSWFASKVGHTTNPKTSLNVELNIGNTTKTYTLNNINIDDENNVVAISFDEFYRLMMNMLINKKVSILIHKFLFDIHNCHFFVHDNPVVEEYIQYIEQLYELKQTINNENE